MSNPRDSLGKLIIIFLLASILSEAGKRFGRWVVDGIVYETRLSAKRLTRAELYGDVRKWAFQLG